MTTLDLPPLPVPPGLRGLEVADTAVGDVRGDEGFFHYRQHSAVELAARRSFDDVWQLMADGALPATAAQAAAFANEVRPLRALPAQVLDALPAVAAASAGAGALDGLRTGLSLLGAADGMRPLWDVDAAQRRADLLRLAAATPTLVAALWRLGHGLEPIEPDPQLGHAADYLRMATGAPPDPEAARALEQYLVLTVDHGFNASTFTARVVASTGADAAACLTAAVGALSGPLHGGAPSRALDLLDLIATPDRAEPVVRSLLARGDRVMGFGHAVYRTDDPRSVHLRRVARTMGGRRAALAEHVEATVTRLLAELRPGRPLYANVEFYAGVVMEACGLDPAQFTPTFAVSRVVGWCANIDEQAASRTIIRPSARYVGPTPPVPVPPLR